MSKTTVNLQLPHRWYDVSPPVAAAICVFALILIGLVVGRIRSTPSPAAEVKPVIIIASPLPQGIPPTAAPIQIATARYVTAFAAPGGVVLGPIPAPPISAVLAKYTDAWLLVPWDGGNVWVRSADIGLPDVADLQPPPAPAVVYVAAPAYSPSYAAPTPVPGEYTVTNEPPEVPTAAPAVVQASDFVQPDLKLKCQFIGCLPGR